MYKQDDARTKQVPVRCVHSIACLACGAGDDTARRQPCPCSSSLRATFGRTPEAKVLTMQCECGVSVEAAARRCDLLQHCAVTEMERGLLGMHGVASETLPGNSITMRFARAAAADAAAAAARCATYDSACKNCVAMKLMRVQACNESHGAIARAGLRLTILLRVVWRRRWVLDQCGSFARHTGPCVIRREQGHRLAWVEFQNNKPHSRMIQAACNYYQASIGDAIARQIQRSAAGACNTLQLATATAARKITVRVEDADD